MKQKIAVLGGGIAGLTIAHELLERGFSVTIFEKNDVVGGKARSFLLNGSLNEEAKFPGEHGFRFFLKWYQNIHDTMKRIPLNNGKTVFDNLISVDELQIDEYNFSFVNKQNLEIKPPLSWLKAMLSCKERHENEYEGMTWDSFVLKNKKNESEREVLFFQNTPKATASVHSTESSVRAMSYTLNRFLTNIGLDVLNGPTNEAWLQPWLDFLIAKGLVVNFNTQVKSLKSKGTKVDKIIFSSEGKIKEEKFDVIVSALPHQNLNDILNIEQKTIGDLGFLDDLKSGWQAGVVLYLKNHLPFPRGHFGLTYSPWAITGILQSDFWTDDFVQKLLIEKNAQASLSLIIADWDAPGIVYHKPAKCCTLPEIIDELKAQLKEYAIPSFQYSFENIEIVDYTIDESITLTGDQQSFNETPLFMNTINSWH